MNMIVPFLVSFVIVLAAVPPLGQWARRLNFLDRPTSRKTHAAPTPLMGGIAIYGGCLLPMLLFSGWTDLTKTILIGGTLLLATGLLDDGFKARGKEFPVWPRLLIYIAASTVPLWFGIQMIGITDIIGEGMLLFPDWLAGFATIAWVFGITNMINFIDGVDGLAAGITTISSLTLLIISLLMQQPDSAVLAAILAGSCIAFLAYNFYPAKIFLGDAGAVFLGYTLAVIALHGAFKSATVVSILVPFLALGVPILDTLIVFARRFKERRGLHRADKLHTHHALMKWGLSQIQTVSFLYLIGAVFSLLSIVLLLAIR